MIDAQERNKQRKILTTITYNDLGIILDVKVEELDSSADLQPTCNQLATDCISRQEAYKVLTNYYHHKTEIQHMGLKEALNIVPTAQQDYDKIIAEIKQCITETREHGKHHAKFVQDNGELYISGLEMALSIIEESR